MFKPKKANYKNVSEWTKSFDDNWNKLVAQDKEAKEKGEMLGRYITHPYADGCATYLITKINQKSVVIEVCVGLGDDWVLPAWGVKTSIPKKLAFSFLDRRDGLAELFGGK